VGLNDGDKNGEWANGGKKRKRDNGGAREENCLRERERTRENEREREREREGRTRESKRRKSSLAREC